MAVIYQTDRADQLNKIMLIFQNLVKKEQTLTRFSRCINIFHIFMPKSQATAYILRPNIPYICARICPNKAPENRLLSLYFLYFPSARMGRFQKIKIYKKLGQSFSTPLSCSRSDLAVNITDCTADNLYTMSNTALTPHKSLPLPHYSVIITVALTGSRLQQK